MIWHPAPIVVFSRFVAIPSDLDVTMRGLYLSFHSLRPVRSRVRKGPVIEISCKSDLNAS
jgi:hypothetical protein